MFKSIFSSRSIRSTQWENRNMQILHFGIWYRSRPKTARNLDFAIFRPLPAQFRDYSLLTLYLSLNNTQGYKISDPITINLYPKKIHNSKFLWRILHRAGTSEQTIWWKWQDWDLITWNNDQIWVQLIWC